MFTSIMSIVSYIEDLSKSNDCTKSISCGCLVLDGGFDADASPHLCSQAKQKAIVCKVRVIKLAERKPKRSSWPR